MGCTPGHRGFSLGWGSALYDQGPRSDLRHCCHTPIARHGHSGQAYRTGFTLAEWLCRALDRIDPARVLGPHHCLQRGASAPDSKIIRRLLQLRQNASVFAQGCADFSSDSSDRNDSFTTHPRRASPSLRPGLSFRYTHLKSWIEAAKKRLHYNVLAIALANKLARIAWAVLAKVRRFGLTRDGDPGR